jgi:hypothetical protein
VKKQSHKKYVIVRCHSAGVFAGYFESRKDREVVLTEVRRLWYWAGGASLSQVAVSGPSRPNECKFPVEVQRIELLEAIEIIDVTPEAQAAIKAVPIWKA